MARLLQARLPNSALVEIDTLREFIHWMPIDQAVPICLHNAASVIRNFSNEGLNVIVPYPISEKNYQYLQAGLSSMQEKIIFITLAPSLSIVLRNRGQRQLTEWEKQRIQHHYEIGINRPSFGTIIDNSDQTPEETVDVVLKQLNEG